MECRFMKCTTLGAVVGVAVLAAGGAQAALQARSATGAPLPYGDVAAVFYYDTELDLTWLRHWNAGAGSPFDDGPSTTDGRMTWGSAIAWAGSLTYFGGGWRLPKVAPVNGSSFQYGASTNGSFDMGHAKTGVGWGKASELGHMYYVTLANQGICTPNDADPTSCVSPQPGWSPTPDSGPFQNLQSGSYWSGTSWRDPPYAWHLGFDGGCQCYFDKSSPLIYAVAVRPGDVAAVPEPQTYAMLLLGLGGVLLAVRRRVSWR
jgi:hypothetical protein